MKKNKKPKVRRISQSILLKREINKLTNFVDTFESSLRRNYDYEKLREEVFQLKESVEQHNFCLKIALKELRDSTGLLSIFGITPKQNENNL